MAEDTHEMRLERWLREEVAQTYDLMREDPSRGIPAEEVLRVIRAHHEEQVRR